MHSLRWFLAGALTLAVVFGVGGLVFIATQMNGFSTRGEPDILERWTARRLRALAVPSQAKAATNTQPDSAEVLAEARAHWADHCAACPANNGSGDVEMGKHLYPPAPDMRQAETQNLSDGELFVIIQNGIRFTGMPAWGSGSAHDTEDSWKLVRFIRHLPKMTAEEEAAMREMNPKSPDELKEEEEEKDFLNGGEYHEQTEHSHH